ncbi:apolipoprotein N-acyltransferase [Candidatus Kryptobacter tengchongensis]|uniref:Apolipoprotein N-acyltransferase n=1 Tax=Kryptobacter tengchongensis TaxID=1643429 RepID=A0A916LIA3_KRYT1|nr:apolipoprotein N-acyltransferase [Candidatus Kryptobacter tengchongensis]CUS97342.1 apolipoprotein N-acyltransferase [Candidatus Kryptobacter tengchongensis]
MKRKIFNERFLLAFVSGVLLSLSFPPLKTGFFATIGFVPLLFLIDRLENYKQLFRYSYIAFFFFNLFTLYWVGGWSKEADPFLMVGCVLLILVHPILFFLPMWFYMFIKKNYGGKLHLFIFPFAFALFEYFRSTTELAFPWLTIGNTQTYFLEKIQFIEFTGIYGLSFLILTVNVIFYLALKEIFREKNFLSKSALRYFIVGVLIYIVPDVYGVYVLKSSDEDSFKEMKVGLIQPDINPWLKWEGTLAEQLELYMGMTKDLIHREPDVELVVYPETAITYYFLLSPYRYHFNWFKSQIDSLNVAILTGFPDARFYDDPSQAPPSSHIIKDTGQRYDAYNAMGLFLPGSDKIQKYAKMILVPFGERLPYADVFHFLIEPLQWGVGISNWAKGKDTTVFEMKRRNGEIVKFSGGVCYESIYPSLIREFVKRGAQFLVVITNDSWYGNTSGPYQHFQYSILRAVENRRSIVRCANGGISGFIDPYGRVQRKTKFHEKTQMADVIRLNDEKTFYTKYGDIIVHISGFAVVLAFLFTMFKKFKIKKGLAK